MTLGVAVVFQVASKTQSIKEAVDKLDLTKIENFCSRKDNARA